MKATMAGREARWAKSLAAAKAHHLTPAQKARLKKHGAQRRARPRRNRGVSLADRTWWLVRNPDL
jgi:hypothetical protein